MHANLDQILEAAMQLSEDDRLAIATRLLNTLPDQPPGLAIDDSDLLDELERRRQEQDRTSDVPFGELWQQG